MEHFNVLKYKCCDRGDGNKVLKRRCNWKEESEDFKKTSEEITWLTGSCDFYNISHIVYKLVHLRINHSSAFKFLFHVVSDVGDVVMLVTYSWRRMLVTEFRWWWHILNVKIVDVGDQYDQKRHQHLLIVFWTFRLTYPSLTSMSPILTELVESNRFHYRTFH